MLTLAVFAGVSWNDFVNYDDPDYVTANPHVKGGLSWENVKWAFTSGFASNWHPLTWLSHMVDWQCFGERAGAHHLVSLGFHIANTLLLFLVLRQMTGAHWRSAMVAGLFAVHPVHVESVAWASERKDVLSTFFFLLTIWAYASYVLERKDRQSSNDEGRMPNDERNSKREDSSKVQSATSKIENKRSASVFYLVALFFFALGLMSKPMLVTVPFVLLLLDFWPLRRSVESGRRNAEQKTTLQPGTLPGQGGERVGEGEVRFWGRLLFEKAPFLVPSAGSCLVTYLVQQKGGAVTSLGNLSIGARVANAVVAYVQYLSKTLWPTDLAVLYPHPGHWPVSQVMLSTAVLVGITVAAVVMGSRRPYILAGWFWFLGTLVPVIGIVQVGIQSMADRYTYIPLIGLFIAAVWGAAELFERTQSRGLSVALSTAVLVVCSGLTLRQVEFWRNSETLFRRTTQVTEKNYLAYNNLGYYLSKEGKLVEAMDNYRRALEINPNYEDAQNNLGYALAGQKKYAEAIAHYEAALRIRPEHVEVHNNLGNALADVGRIDEAMEHYSFVLSKNPKHADAHNNLGIALAMKGRFDKAIEHFHAAIRYKPKYASAHSNLGNALAVQHKVAEAIPEYQEALRLNPKDAQAHNNLGNALMEQGRMDEAIHEYDEALRLNSDNPEAHFNLGLALARQGKREEAAGHYREALRLKPDYSEAQQQMKALGVSPVP